MKKLAVILFCAAAVLCVCRPAGAITTLLGSKQITLTITITPSPSPTPVAFEQNSADRAVAMSVAKAKVLSAKRVGLTAYLLPADPLLRALAFIPIQVGDGGALDTSDMVAQTNPQGSVEVNFTVKLDPTGKYFKILPQDTNLMAGYGANIFPCPYQLYGSYTAAWDITDWVYGASKTTGGIAPDNGFPTYNTTQTSLLEWNTGGPIGGPPTSNVYKAFNNAGTPGETTISEGAVTATICVNLSLTVPATIAPGVYQTTIQYNMYVS